MIIVMMIQMFAILFSFSLTARSCDISRISAESEESSISGIGAALFPETSNHTSKNLGFKSSRKAPTAFPG